MAVERVHIELARGGGVLVIEQADAVVNGEEFDSELDAADIADLAMSLEDLGEEPMGPANVVEEGAS